MMRKRSLIRDYQSEERLFKNRAAFAFVGIILLMGVLIANLFKLQIVQYQDYRTRSNDNRIKVVPISPNRGLIYDRNGLLLAENRPIFNLEIVPEKVRNLDKTIARLQKILPITADQISFFKRELRQTRRFNAIPLMTQLNPRQVAKFAVNQYKFPGVSVTASLKRYYPYGKILTHVLGYVSRINDRDLEHLAQANKLANYQATRDIGKLGIERYYEDILHGQSGYQEVEVNSRGRIIRTLKYVPPCTRQRFGAEY